MNVQVIINSAIFSFVKTCAIDTEYTELARQEIDLLGEVFSKDEQCVMKHGPGSVFSVSIPWLFFERTFMNAAIHSHSKPACVNYVSVVELFPHRLLL